MLSKQKIALLKKYFATQPVDVVYLFGSQTNGKSTKLSDADLAVLFREDLTENERFDLKLSIIPKVCGILKMERADVVDLEKAPSALIYSAISPKKEIFTRNNKRRAVFEAASTSRYFDEKYFIRENTNYSLASIAKI